MHAHRHGDVRAHRLHTDRTIGRRGDRRQRHECHRERRQDESERDQAHIGYSVPDVSTPPSPDADEGIVDKRLGPDLSTRGGRERYLYCENSNHVPQRPVLPEVWSTFLRGLGFLRDGNDNGDHGPHNAYAGPVLTATPRWVRGVAWSILGGSGPLDSGSNPDGPIHQVFCAPAIVVPFRISPRIRDESRDPTRR